MVGHLSAHAHKTTPSAPPPPLLRRGIYSGGSADTSPEKGNRPRKIPLWGGVAVAKRLTGWLVTFLHTLTRPPRRLRRHPS